MVQWPGKMCPTLPGWYALITEDYYVTRLPVFVVDRVQDLLIVGIHLGLQVFVVDRVQDILIAETCLVAQIL